MVKILAKSSVHNRYRYKYLLLTLVTTKIVVTKNLEVIIIKNPGNFIEATTQGRY